MDKHNQLVVHGEQRTDQARSAQRNEPAASAAATEAQLHKLPHADSERPPTGNAQWKALYSAISQYAHELKQSSQNKR